MPAPGTYNAYRSKLLAEIKRSGLNINEIPGPLDVSSVGWLGTSGGVLAFIAPTVVASSVALTASALVLGGGPGATPTPMGSLGTATTVLHGNAAGAPTFGTVTLTSDVGGVLPVGNGGTNSAAALSGSSIMVSNGSAIVQGAAGTSTTVLHGNASGTPTYGAVSLTADVTGDLPYSSLAQGSALSVLGVAGNATADNASIAAGSDHQVLRRSGTSIGFGQVNLAQAAAVTGTLTVGNGGTGIASGTSGGILGFTGSTTIASSGALTANALVLGGGAGATPSTPVGLGTSTQVLHGNAGGAPTWSQVSLTADVTGDLPFANLTQGSALSVLGVAGNATADVASIAAGSDGDVLRRSGTSLGFGTIATAGIGNDQVTYAKIQNISVTQRVLGRNTAGAGDTEEVTVTQVLDWISSTRGSVLYRGGSGWEALAPGASGTFLRSAGAGADPSYNLVDVSSSSQITGDLAYSNLAQGSALSVLGVAGNATADNASIAAASDHQVLRRSGTSIGFGAVDLSQANAVTGDLPFSNLAQGNALSVLGVAGNATADVASIVAGSDGHVLLRSGTSIAFGQIATAGIANDQVTYAKIQNISATQRILGRNTAGAGDTEEITISNALDWLSTTRGAIPYQSGATWGGLSPGTTKFPLISNGAGADPSYGNLSLAAADAVVTGTLAIANGGTGSGTASGAFTNLKQAASDTDTGVLEIAVQSEMETATDTTRAVVPGRVQYHPGVAKAWLKCDAAGSIQVSHNVTSITDTGTGLLTVTWDTDFSGANYVTTANAHSGNQNFVTVSTQLAGSCAYICWRSDTAALADPTNYSIEAHGDQ